MRDEGDSVSVWDHLGQFLDTYVGALVWRWNRSGGCGVFELRCPSSSTNLPLVRCQGEVGYERQLRKDLDWMRAYSNLPDCMRLDFVALLTPFDRIWFFKRHCYWSQEAG